MTMQIDFGRQLIGTGVVLDPDYERLSGRAQVRRLYDWCRRAYYWAQVIDIGRYDGVKSDPDGAIQPEYGLFATVAAPHIFVHDGQKETTLEAMVRWLRTHQPASHQEIAEALGIPKSTVRASMLRTEGTFAVDHVVACVKYWRVV
jgi:hypothetical protein